MEPSATSTGKVADTLEGLSQTLMNTALPEASRNEALLHLGRLQGLLEAAQAPQRTKAGPCIGLMVDGDARTLAARYWQQGRRDIRGLAHADLGQWAADLEQIYAHNALWLLELVLGLGASDRQTGRASTVVVFITNQDNQKREGGTNASIMRAVSTVGMAWPRALEAAGIDFYIGGDRQTVEGVIAQAAEAGLRILPLDQLPAEPTRTSAICLLGYQAGVLAGFDPAVYRIPEMDLFLRSTHMRLSDMWLPAMKQTLFWSTELNLGYYYPQDVLRLMLDELDSRSQTRHDACNTYADAVYERWHQRTQQEEGFLFVSRESLPSELVKLPLRRLTPEGNPVFVNA